MRPRLLNMTISSDEVEYFSTGHYSGHISNKLTSFFFFCCIKLPNNSERKLLLNILYESLDTVVLFFFGILSKVNQKYPENIGVQVTVTENEGNLNPVEKYRCLVTA